MKRTMLIILATLFLVSVNSAGAWEMSVVTTTWTPFVYEEKGEITGLGTKIVQAVLARAGIKTDIRLYPWKRAIKTAGEEKNVLIYPLIRIGERQQQFVWVAPIFKARMHLYKLGKRKEIIIHSLDDARKYTIGVLRGAAMYLDLLARGFEDETQLVQVASNRKSVELLFMERVDLIAENPLAFHREASALGFFPGKAEAVFQLFEKEAYMAFRKGSSETLVKRLANAMEQLRSDGTIDAIFRQFEKNN